MWYHFLFVYCNIFYHKSSANAILKLKEEPKGTLSALLLIKQFLEEALILAGVSFAKGLCQLLEELFLLVCQIFRCFNNDLQNIIALALGVYVGNALALERERCAGLGAVGDRILLGLAVEGGNIDACAECCLGE